MALLLYPILKLPVSTPTSGQDLTHAFAKAQAFEDVEHSQPKLSDVLSYVDWQYGELLIPTLENTVVELCVSRCRGLGYGSRNSSSKVQTGARAVASMAREEI